MQRPPAKVAVGDRFEDPRGKTFVVTEIREGHPFLLDDSDLLETQQCLWEEAGTWEWITRHSAGPLHPIESSPEMTRIVRAEVLRQCEIEEAWQSVPAGNVPDLYNSLVEFDMWKSPQAERLLDPAELLHGRKETLQRVVELAGALATAATLLDVTASGLSCALGAEEAADR